MILENVWFYAFLISMFLNVISLAAIYGSVPREVALKAFDSIPDSYFDKISEMIDNKLLHDESILNDVLSHLKDSAIDYAKDVGENAVEE